MDLSLMIKPEDVLCTACDCKFFKQVFIIKRVSRLALATAKDDIQLFPVFRCDDCGEIVESLLPPEN